MEILQTLPGSNSPNNAHKTYKIASIFSAEVVAQIGPHYSDDIQPDLSTDHRTDSSAAICITGFLLEKLLFI